MIYHALKTFWTLLDAREKWMSGVTLVIATLGAGAQVLMVGAILPFLTILSDPAAIHDRDILAKLSALSGAESDYAFVFMLGIATVLVILLANIVVFFRVYAITRFARMRAHSIAARLAGGYLRQDYEYFLNRRSDDMSRRVLDETQELALSFIQPLAEFIASALAVLFLVVFLVVMKPAVTVWGILLVVGVYALVFAVTKGRTALAGRRRVAANSERYQAISEAFGGIKDIKVIGREDAFFARFHEGSKMMAKAQIQTRILAELPRFLVQTLFFGGFIIACLVLIDAAAFNGNAGALSEIVPLLGVFAFAGQRMIPELQKAYQGLSKIVSGSASLDSICADMAADRPVGMPSVERIAFTDRLSLRHVSYSYDPAVAPGLDDISLDIRKGERIGVVGGTGAGKTTFSDLCLGLLAPTTGDVAVDGRRLATRPDLDAWRRCVGYVPQSIFLVDGSIAENIALGVASDEIDHERVARCARIACLDTFIRTETPDGYHSRTGERGVRLSGGQKQRIGIARALYQGADFLVMDEATSALDTATERDVMAAIDALPSDLTLVMVAHRLSTVKRCDRILVLEKGHLVQDGSWDELTDQDGPFRDMAAAADGA